MVNEHEKFIRRTVELAAAAREKGNEPFGALLVRNGEVVLEAENSQIVDRDITGHAETNLVRRGWKELGPEILAECTLYTSTEPCAMCCGAIYWAGIPRMVFGCSAETLYGITGGGLHTPSAELFARGDREVEVIGPVLEEEALKVHEGYWED